jgi:hypothetical protein
MNQQSPAHMRSTPVALRRSLTQRILRRLIFIVLMTILGYGLVIALWILMAPRA